MGIVFILAGILVAVFADKRIGLVLAIIGLVLVVLASR